mmetsp:Transcript_6442/g.19499  ORF Transcript_6442/g.19499 Transcript_6442/m.19499 type:complete len:213 (+) Transcript_6442:133-771(+)
MCNPMCVAEACTSLSFRSTRSALRRQRVRDTAARWRFRYRLQLVSSARISLGGGEVDGKDAAVQAVVPTAVSQTPQMSAVASPVSWPGLLRVAAAEVSLDGGEVDARDAAVQVAAPTAVSGTMQMSVWATTVFEPGPLRAVVAMVLDACGDGAVCENLGFFFKFVQRCAISFPSGTFACGWRFWGKEIRGWGRCGAVGPTRRSSGSGTRTSY